MKQVQRFIAVLLIFALGVDHAMATAFSPPIEIAVCPIRIPARWGRVTEVCDARSRLQAAGNSKLFPRTLSLEPRAPLIVLIQDLHGNVGVQRNIAEIIKYVASKQLLLQAPGSRLRRLFRAYSLEPRAPLTVFLEGAHGPFDVAPLRNIDNPWVKNQMVNRLLGDFKITGSEVAAIEADQPLHLWGVDDKSLYLANLKAFYKASFQSPVPHPRNKIWNDYYAVAKQRDVPLALNTLAHLDLLRKTASPPRLVSVVAGGYHTEGITQILRANQVPYIVVTPVVPSLGYEQLYSSQLRRSAEEIRQGTLIRPILLGILSFGMLEKIDLLQHIVPGLRVDLASIAPLSMSHLLALVGSLTVVAWVSLASAGIGWRPVVHASHNGFIRKGGRAFKQMVENIVAGRFERVDQDLHVKDDLNEIRRRFKEKFKKDLPVSDSLPIIETNAIVISTGFDEEAEDYIFGFHSQSSEVRGLLEKKPLLRDALDRRFPKGVIVLSRHEKGRIRQEALYHELRCVKVGHNAAIFEQQRLFPDNYKHGEFEEERGKLYLPGFKGDDTKPFKGDLGERIRRNIILMELESMGWETPFRESQQDFELGTIHVEDANTEKGDGVEEFLKRLAKNQDEDDKVIAKNPEVHWVFEQRDQPKGDTGGNPAAALYSLVQELRQHQSNKAAKPANIQESGSRASPEQLISILTAREQSWTDDLGTRIHQLVRLTLDEKTIHIPELVWKRFDANLPPWFWYYFKDLTERGNIPTQVASFLGNKLRSLYSKEGDSRLRTPFMAFLKYLITRSPEILSRILDEALEIPKAVEDLTAILLQIKTESPSLVLRLRQGIWTSIDKAQRFRRDAEVRRGKALVEDLMKEKSKGPEDAISRKTLKEGLLVGLIWLVLWSQGIGGAHPGVPWFIVLAPLAGMVLIGFLYLDQWLLKWGAGFLKDANRAPPSHLFGLPVQVVQGIDFIQFKDDHLQLHPTLAALLSPETSRWIRIPIQGLLYIQGVPAHEILHALGMGEIGSYFFAQILPATLGFVGGVAGGVPLLQGLGGAINIPVFLGLGTLGALSGVVLASIAFVLVKKRIDLPEEVAQDSIEKGKEYQDPVIGFRQDPGAPRRFDFGNRQSRPLAVSANGRFLVFTNPSGEDLHEVSMMDLSTRERVTLHPSVQGDILSAAVTDNGDTAAIALRDSIRIWRMQAGAPRFVKTVERREEIVTTLAVSPDGTRLASGTRDGVVRIWDITPSETLDPVAEWRGHRGGVRSLAFDETGQRLASGGEDTFVKIWDMGKNKELPIPDFQAHSSAVKSLVFGGESLASADEAGRINLWDLAGLEKNEPAARASRLNFKGDSLEAMAFHRGRLILAGEQTIEMFDLRDLRHPKATARYNERLTLGRLIAFVDDRTVVWIGEGGVGWHLPALEDPSREARGPYTAEEYDAAQKTYQARRGALPTPDQMARIIDEAFNHGDPLDRAADHLAYTDDLEKAIDILHKRLGRYPTAAELEFLAKNFPANFSQGAGEWEPKWGYEVKRQVEYSSESAYGFYLIKTVEVLPLDKMKGLLVRTRRHGRSVSEELDDLIQETRLDQMIALFEELVDQGAATIAEGQRYMNFRMSSPILELIAYCHLRSGRDLPTAAEEFFDLAKKAAESHLEKLSGLTPEIAALVAPQSLPFLLQDVKDLLGEEPPAMEAFKGLAGRPPDLREMKAIVLDTLRNGNTAEGLVVNARRRAFETDLEETTSLVSTYLKRPLFSKEVLLFGMEPRQKDTESIKSRIGPKKFPDLSAPARDYIMYRSQSSARRPDNFQKSIARFAEWDQADSVPERYYAQKGRYPTASEMKRMILNAHQAGRPAIDLPEDDP